MSDDDLQISLGPSSGPSGPPPGGSASGLEVNVEIIGRVLEEMDEHVAEDTSVEYGGVMVGRVHAATGTTQIVGAIRAIGAESDIASLRFTHETWDHIGRVMERDFPGAQMVGWYHSHPHFGIFLSEHDQFIHRNFFSQPWQVAYVRDPLLDQRGFFAWQGDQIIQIPEDEEATAEVDAATLVDPTAPPPLTMAPPPVSRIVVTDDPPGVAPVPVATGGRSGGKRTLLVVVAALVLVAGAAAALLAGPFASDDADAELAVDLQLASDRTAPAGTYITIGTASAGTPAEAGRIVWDSSVVATNASQGQELEVGVLHDDATGLATVLTNTANADPGLYQGTITAWACPNDQDCSRDEAVLVGRRPFDVTVERPWAGVWAVDDITALELEDCLDGVQPGAEAIEVEALECEEGPQVVVFEAYESAVTPEAAESTDEQILNLERALTVEAATSCVSAFEDRLDQSYSSLQTGVAVLLPTVDQWVDGTRSVRCVLVDWEPPETGGAPPSSGSASDEATETPT